MRPTRTRWLILAAGVLATAAGCAFQFGLPFLVPRLRADGLSLAQAGVIVACPSLGLMLTLVLWGAATDRWGERSVLASGLALAVPALFGAALAGRRGPDGAVLMGFCLIAAGAAGASVHAASGRLILGWFDAHERGLAMGFRQTAQPLGVGAAAMSLPGLATHGIAVALVALAVACLGAAALVVIVVRDPEHQQVVDGEQSGSPYRTAVLWRIHVASALLVVPQFTVAAFGLAFLVDRHGFTAVDGGRLLAITQIGGATARLAAGWWSDRVGSRLRPLRQVSLGVAIILAALAAGAWSGSPLAVGVLLVAAVVTVSPNGLAFTAVAEFSGRAWAGRALGIQNTGQNAVASLTPPLIAAIIAGHGYGAAFALAAGLPLVAVGLVPVASVPAALVPAADVTARSADHPPEPPTDEVMAATTIPPTRTTSPTTINNPR